MKARLLLLSCLGIFAVGAQAQNAPSAPAATPAPSVQEACKGDYEKLCAGVKRGGGRILSCLNSHRGELTTACQEALPKAPTKDTSAADPASQPH
jgi:hypothetical protein